MVLLFGTALLLAAIVIGGSLQFVALVDAQRDRLAFETASGEVRRLDEVLTMSALMGVTSGDEAWRARYEANIAPLDAALAEAVRAGGQSVADALAAVNAANQSLIALETRAFALAQAGDQDAARQMLEGPVYAFHKSAYSAGVAQALRIGGAEVEARIRSLQMRRLLGIVIGLLATFGACFVWWRVLREGMRSEDAMDAAEQERARVDAILAYAPCGVAVLDAKLRFLTANQQVCEELGASPDQLFGRALVEAVPSSAANIAPMCRRALAGEVVGGDHAPFRLANGELRYLAFQIGPWRLPSGAIGGVTIVSLDITALAREKRRLERAHKMLAEMQSISSVGAAELDIATGKAWFSDETYRIFGLDPATPPDPHRMVGMVADPEEYFAAFKALARSGGALDIERQFTLDDGRQRWVRLKFRREGEPKVGRLIGAVQDVTDRKAIEAELRAAHAEAEAANAAKSAFLANMSHEIRTPLNGVIGLAGALGRQELSAEQAEMVRLIEGSGQTLERLLGDILDLSKVEAGQLELLQAPFDLRETVESAAHLLRVRAEEKGLRFAIAYAPGADGMFVGDAVRLKQIVANLASNAIKFTEHGSVSIGVAIRDDTLSIDVADTGIGFDAATGKRLFTRFEQADGSITRRYGGSGLGLAISRALAQAMGGDVGARSTEGVGSVFTLRLPLVRAEGVAAAAEPAAPLELARRLDILVADDHAVNRKVVEMILAPLGAALTFAEDGAEAIAAFHAQRFDLVIMDMQMPNVDGLTATRALREIEAREGRARTPIAMLTANAMSDHRRDALDAGADLHIAKPVTPAKLLEGLEAALAAADTTLRGADRETPDPVRHEAV
jgi:PAS domain S-box-containing protein